MIMQPAQCELMPIPNLFTIALDRFQREVSPMKNRAIVAVLTALLVGLFAVSAFAIEPYSQDFEGLNQADTGALGADGWLVFANVFGPGGAPYLYGYGVFPAPNDGGGFSQIAVGEGGATQGNQQLNIFSDYNNVDHAVGNLIEANTFQEMVVGPGDVGEVWVFEFDAKRANLAGATTALAFIKTLDPNAGFATTNFITSDMTTIPTTWGTYQVSIVIDPSLVGQLLQIGFANSCTNYEGSGVFYDNVNFSISGPVATEDMSWGGVKSLYR